jgi:hypothetical protein
MTRWRRICLCSNNGFSFRPSSSSGKPVIKLFPANIYLHFRAISEAGGGGVNHALSRASTARCDANPADADANTVRLRLIWSFRTAIPMSRTDLSVTYSSFLFVAVPSSLPSLVSSISRTSSYYRPNLLRPI